MLSFVILHEIKMATLSYVNLIIHTQCHLLHCKEKAHNTYEKD
jgi:hypothetical protein